MHLLVENIFIIYYVVFLALFLAECNEIMRLGLTDCRKDLWAIQKLLRWSRFIVAKAIDTSIDPFSFIVIHK